MRAPRQSSTLPIMDRRAFLATVTGLFFAALTVEAQQATLARVGVLWIASRGQNLLLMRSLEEGFRALGYIPGQNIVIEHRFADGKLERLADLIDELVRLNVNVLVVGVNTGAIAAKKAGRTIPIVTAAASDPVGAGLAKSLARPGGNVTGLTFDAAAEIYSRNLQFLRETLPKASRMATVWNPDAPINAPFLKPIEDAAGQLGVKLIPAPVRSTSEADAAFALMNRERVGGFVVVGDPVLYEAQLRINDLALRDRLPSIWPFREGAASGGLMSYGPSLPDLFRRAAFYVDRILKGANAGDLPIEQPTKFELIINMKTAKALGLTIPQSLLLRADELIQ